MARTAGTARAGKGKKKASAKNRAPERTKRAHKGWGQTWEFVKELPDIETPRKDSVFGCVYYALRGIKKGSVTEVVDEAERLGLKKHTQQSTRKQVQVKLRRMRRKGVARVTKQKDAPRAPKGPRHTARPAPAPRPAKGKARAPRPAPAPAPPVAKAGKGTARKAPPRTTPAPAPATARPRPRPRPAKAPAPPAQTAPAEPTAATTTPENAAPDAAGS